MKGNNLQLVLHDYRLKCMKEALIYSIVEVFENYEGFTCVWKIVIKHQLWESYGNQVPL